MKPLTKIIQDYGFLAAIVVGSMIAVYLMPKTPTNSSPAEYTTAKASLDSTYRAKRKQAADSLDKWYIASAESLKAKYQR